MKKQFTILLALLGLMLFINYPSSGQKNAESKQYATLTNNAFSGIKIFRIDSSLMDQYSGKNQLEEGFHVIESIPSNAFRGYIPVQRSYIQVEKNKTYQVKNIDCNYLDTVENCFYMNYPYVQFTEKSSEKEVGGMINKIRQHNDSICIQHLYPGKILPTTELAHISINNGSNIFILSGRTSDECRISYISSKPASSGENLDLYLKPGWYNYEYLYQDQSGTTRSGLKYFRVKANQALVTIIKDSIHCVDPEFFTLWHTLSLNDIQFLPDGKHGWIVGGIGIILSTEDGGNHWNMPGDYRVISGNIEHIPSDPLLNMYYGLNCVCFIDTLNGWVGGDLGFIMHTQDGGKTWMRYPNNVSKDIKEIHFFNANNGFICLRNHATGDFGLALTDNGGKTWTELKRDPLSRRYLSKSIGIIKIAENELSLSENHGLSWQKVLTIDPGHSELYKDYPSYDFPRNCDFINKDIGWILTNRSILSTRDGGLTWNIAKLPLTHNAWFDMVGKIFPDEPVNMTNIRFSDISTGYCVGNEGCILHSKDGGATWVFQKSHTNEVLTDIAFNGSQVWIIGNRGCLLKKDDGDTCWKYQNVLDLIVNQPSKRDVIQ